MAIDLMGHGRTVEARGWAPGKALQQTVVLKDLLNRLDVLAGHGLHRARHGRAVEDAHEVHSSLEGANATGIALDARGDIPDVRNLIEAILLGLDGSPVTSLGGLPLTHVALGLNVGETRDGTVGATEVGAVDNNLMTGEDAHRMSVLLVLLNEVAERDVITRGILDAGQNALGAELGKELPGSLVWTHTGMS